MSAILFSACNVIYRRSAVCSMKHTAYEMSSCYGHEEILHTHTSCICISPRRRGGQRAGGWRGIHTHTHTRSNTWIDSVWYVHVCVCVEDVRAGLVSYACKRVAKVDMKHSWSKPVGPVYSSSSSSFRIALYNNVYTRNNN